MTIFVANMNFFIKYYIHWVWLCGYGFFFVRNPFNKARKILLLIGGFFAQILFFNKLDIRIHAKVLVQTENV